MKQVIIISIAWIGFVFNTFSQTVQDSSSRIVVYDSYVPVAKEYPKLKNFIAISPLSIFIGDFPLTYERKIAGPLNIMIGGGLTSKNSIYDLTSMGGNTIFDNSAYYSDRFNRSTDMGYNYVIQPKIYLRDHYFNGIYLGMEYKFRHYNYTSTTYDDPTTNTTVSVGEVKEYRNVADLKFNCGWAYNIGSNVVIDFYVGVGTRNNTYHYADYENLNGYNGIYTVSPLTPTAYVIQYQTVTKETVTVSTGFRIGYAF